MCTLCTLRRTGLAAPTQLSSTQSGHRQGQHLVMLPLDQGCLDTLMESTFNQVGDIFGSDFNDIGMDEDSDDQNLVNIDSRLDVESVLIEDIKFDLDAIDSRLTDYANYPPEVPNSVSSSDDEVSQGIKCESRVESDENLETLSPQQRDRCNTWPRQLQEARYGKVCKNHSLRNLTFPTSQIPYIFFSHIYRFFQGLLINISLVKQ